MKSLFQLNKISTFSKVLKYLQRNHLILVADADVWRKERVHKHKSSNIKRPTSHFLKREAKKIFKNSFVNSFVILGLGIKVRNPEFQVMRTLVVPNITAYPNPLAL